MKTDIDGSPNYTPKQMNLVVNEATKEIDRLRRLNARLRLALEEIRADDGISLTNAMRIEQVLQAAKERR